MNSLIRYMSILAVLLISGTIYAQLPTAEQVGLYSGKGYVIYYDDLESAKQVKERAAFVLKIEANGSCDLQIITDGGGLQFGSGEGRFGSEAAVIRTSMFGTIFTGKIAFKGKNAVKSASGKVELVEIFQHFALGEAKMKLKKVQQ